MDTTKDKSAQPNPASVERPVPPGPSPLASRRRHRRWAVVALVPLLLTGRPHDAASPSSTSDAVAYQASDARVLQLVAAEPERAPPQVVATVFVGDEQVARYEGRMPAAFAVPSGPARLVVEAPGRARFSLTLDPDQAEVRLPFEDGARIAGLVHVSGQPLPPGTRVDALREPGTGERWSADVDASGHFAFDTLVPGQYRVRVRAPGYAELVRVWDTSDSGVLDLELAREAAVAGRVIDEQGLPSEGATLVLAGSGLWPPRRAEADADGRFVFRGVPAGVYEVQAFDEARRAPPRRGVEVDAGGRAFLTFELAPGRRVRGVVTDAETGEPVADAQVTLAAQTLDAAPRAAVSDIEGRFNVGGASEGPLQMSVSAEGYVAVRGVEVPLTGAVRVELERGAVVAGVVLDEDGRPIEGASIEVIGEDESEQPIALSASSAFRSTVFVTQLETNLPPLPVIEGEVPAFPTTPAFTQELPLETILPPPPLPESEGELRAAASHRSDADGAFRIEGVPGGHVQVIARLAGLAPDSTPRIFVASGTTRDDFELVLRPAGRLLVRVEDARGAAARGVIVEARSDTEGAPRIEVSDADGALTFSGVVGELIVTALPYGQPAVRGRAEVRSDLDTELTLTLSSALFTLEGRTVDERGFPRAEVQVSVRSLRAERPFSRTVISGTDGTFAVADLPEPPLRIEAREVGRVAAQIDLFETPDREVPVALELGATVPVEVLEEASGEPAVGAQVRLIRDGLPPEILEAQTDERGRVDLGLARVGEWSLEVEGADFVAQPARQVVITEARTQDLVRVRVSEGGALSGTVIDAGGAPLRGARVRAGLRQARTERDGTFRIRGLGPGDLVVVADHPAAGEGEAVSHVRAGSETPGVVVRLPERYEPANAAALPGRRRGVAVVIARTAGRIVVSRVIEGSRAERSGLRAGDELLLIDGDEPGTAREARSLLAGPTSVPVVLRLRRGELEAHLVVERERYLPE